MSLSTFQVRLTREGCEVMNAARSESTVADLLKTAPVETLTVPPARTSPEVPSRWRRLVSVATRTWASLKACLLTSYVTATAEKGEATSDPQAQSASARDGSTAGFIRERPSASARRGP